MKFIGRLGIAVKLDQKSRIDCHRIITLFFCSDVDARGIDLNLFGQQINTAVFAVEIQLHMCGGCIEIDPVEAIGKIDGKGVSHQGLIAVVCHQHPCAVWRSAQSERLLLLVETDAVG